MSLDLFSSTSSQLAILGRLPEGKDCLRLLTNTCTFAHLRTRCQASCRLIFGQVTSTFKVMLAVSRIAQQRICRNKIEADSGGAFQ